MKAQTYKAALKVSTVAVRDQEALDRLIKGLAVRLIHSMPIEKVRQIFDVEVLDPEVRPIDKKDIPLWEQIKQEKTYQITVKKEI